MAASATFDYHGVKTTGKADGYRRLCDAEILESSEKAILVGLPTGASAAGGEKHQWLPKSQVRWVEHREGKFWPDLYVKTWLVVQNDLWFWVR